MLFKLPFDEADGQPGSIDRNINGAQQVGQRSDMVLVPMGDKNAPNMLCCALGVGKIRDDQIDTQEIFIGKSQTAIHNNAVLVAFVKGHVFADLAQSPQRNDAQRGAARLRHGFLLMLFGGPSAALLRR